MSAALILQMTEEYQEYLRDESRKVGTAETISFPKSEEEVVSILHHCDRENIPVTIQGARTGLAAAASPQGGHVLNMSRMNRVLGCRNEKEGYYLTVQPGVVLSALRKMLQERKFDTAGWSEASLEALHSLELDEEYFFSPDPTEASATIGGMTVCNASGARSFLYGATRNYITALTVCLIDGRRIHVKRGQTMAKKDCLTIIAEGGSNISLQLPKCSMPETKNTSGYYMQENMDAIDLFIGSDGTLGVITEIEIKLLKKPKTIYGTVCFFKNEKQAVDFVVSARKNIDHIASMEFFDGNALAVLRRQKTLYTAFSQLPAIDESAGSAIYLELHCANEEDALQQLFAIGEELECCGGDAAKTWVARNQADIDRMHFFRHAVPESVNMLIDERKKRDAAITKLGSDMAVPDEQLPAIMAYYQETVQALGLESATWGHIGNNHVHVNILPRNKEEYEEGKRLFKRWAQKVTELKGAVSAEHGVGKLKRDFLPIMYGKDILNGMWNIKMAFDTKGLLGQGTIFDPVGKETVQ